MKNFNIFKNSFGHVQVVKEGWSWPAFILQFFNLGWIWAFVKGLWGTGIMLLLWAMITLGAMADPSAFAAYSLISLILWIGMGAMANKTLSSKLLKKGYIVSRVVQAPSKEAAFCYNHEDEKK